MQNDTHTIENICRSIPTSDPNDFQTNETGNNITTIPMPKLHSTQGTVLREPWLATGFSNGSIFNISATTDNRSPRRTNSGVEIERDNDREDTIRTIIENSESILQKPGLTVRFNGCDFCTQCGRQVDQFGTDEFGYLYEDSDDSDKEGENS